jgi:hypothetical protein
MQLGNSESEIERRSFGVALEETIYRDLSSFNNLTVYGAVCAQPQPQREGDHDRICRRTLALVYGSDQQLRPIWLEWIFVALIGGMVAPCSLYSVRMLLAVTRADLKPHINRKASAPKQPDRNMTDKKARILCVEDNRDFARDDRDPP